MIKNMETELVPVEYKSKWEGKTSEQIMNDLMGFIKRVQSSPPIKPNDKLKPYWSKVLIENKAELERLENCRKSIYMFYDSFTGPIFFIGYSDTPRGKADRWYMPLLSQVLEINSASDNIGIHQLPQTEQFDLFESSGFGRFTK